MRSITICATALAAASLGAATTANAWGPEGHTVVARVATAHLSPQAATDLTWIISVGVPALNAQIQQQYGMKCQIDPADPWGPIPNFNTDHDQHTNLANWADCYRFLNASTGGWHFDDIPLSETPTGPLDAGNQKWCDPAQSCASAALADNLRKLSSPGLAPADTAMALAFVVHFVGDMHQPLHDEDNGDRGGNDVTVVTTGSGAPSTKELHALWDTPLVKIALGTSDLDSATTALTAEAATKPTPTYATVSDVVAASDGWVEDAHRLAQPAYSLLNIPAGAGAQANVQITRSYVRQESAVVKSQLALAAVRLRAVLDAVLTWSPPS